MESASVTLKDEDGNAGSGDSSPGRHQAPSRKQRQQLRETRSTAKNDVSITRGRAGECQLGDEEEEFEGKINGSKRGPRPHR